MSSGLTVITTLSVKALCYSFYKGKGSIYSRTALVGFSITKTSPNRQRYAGFLRRVHGLAEIRFVA